MDWIGAILQLVGRWRIAGMHLDAFLWSIIGRTMFVVWYGLDADYPIVLVALVSIVFEARAWAKWRAYKGPSKGPAKSCCK